MASALAGALLGFLRYNFPPASIFLGDAGSMLVGLVLGTLAIESSLKTPATIVLSFPVALLALPIFDTTAAIVRRKLTGRSLYSTDPRATCTTACSAVGSPPGRCCCWCRCAAPSPGSACWPARLLTTS